MPSSSELDNTNPQNLLRQLYYFRDILVYDEIADTVYLTLKDVIPNDREAIKSGLIAQLDSIISFNELALERGGDRAVQENKYKDFYQTNIDYKAARIFIRSNSITNNPYLMEPLFKERFVALLLDQIHTKGPKDCTGANAPKFLANLSYKELLEYLDPLPVESNSYRVTTMWCFFFSNAVRRHITRKLKPLVNQSSVSYLLSEELLALKAIEGESPEDTLLRLASNEFPVDESGKSEFEISHITNERLMLKAETMGFKTTNHYIEWLLRK